MTGRATHPGRRSFVLLAVLVIVGAALLVVTGLLFMAQADVAGAANASDRVQTRALAWSGVQAVMSSLNEQRHRILDGEVPRVDEEYVIFDSDGEIGLVRLLPIDAGGAIIVPEAGRIDLNGADAGMLAATGLVGDALAEAVIAHRDGALRGSFDSVAELLHVPGMTPEILYGPLEEITVMDDARPGTKSLAERVGDRLAVAEPRGLADVVTVYAFEPTLQRSGALRISLIVDWSFELGRRVDDRFGEGSSAVLRPLFEDGTRFESDAEIYRVLREMQVPLEQWAEIVDALTTVRGGMSYGRLDVNTATPEALAALPGIEPEDAARIVRARDGLGPDERASATWPAVAGIVAAEAYDELADRITTRSWTYRLRLAAAVMPADDPEAALINPVIYEVVIDLADPAPRVAYLRDVTLLQTSAMLAVATSSSVDEADAGASDDAPPSPLGRRDPGVDEDGAAEEDGAADESAAADGEAEEWSPPPPSSFDLTPPAMRGPPRSSVGGSPASADARGDAAGQPDDDAAPPSRRGRRVGRWRGGR